MGISLVQQKTGTGADGSGGVTVIFDSPITEGNSVVIVFSVPRSNAEQWPSSPGDPFTNQTLQLQDSGSSPVDSVVLFGGNVQSPGSGCDLALAYIHAVPSGAGRLFVQMSGSGRCNVQASEWSGLLNAGLDGGFVSSVVTSDSTPDTANVDPAATNNLVIAAGSWPSDGYSAGPNNSFTRMTAVGGDAVWQESAYRIRSADGSAISTGWTLSSALNSVNFITSFGGVAPPSAGFFQFM